MGQPITPSRGRVARRGDALDRPIAAGLNLDPGHINVIDQSHERCHAFGLSRIERPDLGLIARSDLAIARDRNLRLHQHAAPVMELLYDQIVNTQSMVVLTDATGTILHAIGDDDFLDRASKVALQPGAVWSESCKGTNAVGTALMEEKPTLVHADEHFFHANHFLTCSAAPILDPRGNILGVLDVSGDHRSYHQHTMALVKMSARMIENHWLSDDYRSVMRLHFHRRVEFIGTLMEGIIAVKPDGRIVGANRGALEQLGLSGATLRMQTLESLFGTSVGTLVDRFRSPLATPLAVQHGGRSLHLHARFDWPVWTSLAEAVAAQVPSAAMSSATLRDATIDALLKPAAPPAPAINPTPLPLVQDAQVALVLERATRGLEHGRQSCCTARPAAASIGWPGGHTMPRGRSGRFACSPAAPPGPTSSTPRWRRARPLLAAAAGRRCSSSSRANCLTWRRPTCCAGSRPAPASPIAPRWCAPACSRCARSPTTAACAKTCRTTSTACRCGCRRCASAATASTWRG